MMGFGIALVHTDNLTGPVKRGRLHWDDLHVHSLSRTHTNTSQYFLTPPSCPPSLPPSLTPPPSLPLSLTHPHPHHPPPRYGAQMTLLSPTTVNWTGSSSSPSSPKSIHFAFTSTRLTTSPQPEKSIFHWTLPTLTSSSQHRYAWGWVGGGGCRGGEREKGGRQKKIEEEKGRRREREEVEGEEMVQGGGLCKTASR